jgi:hypothetical protein
MAVEQKHFTGVFQLHYEGEHHKTRSENGTNDCCQLFCRRFSTKNRQTLAGHWNYTEEPQAWAESWNNTQHPQISAENRNNTEHTLTSSNGRKATTFVWYHRTMAAYPTMPHVDGE